MARNSSKVTARHVYFPAREVRICASHNCFGDFSSRFIFAGNPGYKEKKRRPPPASRYFAHTWILLPRCAKTPNESGFWGSREIKQRCCCLHRCCCCSNSSSNILRPVFLLRALKGIRIFLTCKNHAKKFYFSGKYASTCILLRFTFLYYCLSLSLLSSPSLPFNRGSNGDT